MKLCFKCNKEKPIYDFYKHPGTLDGRLNKCKPCARRDTRENRAANIEYYKEYDRNRPNEDARKKQRHEYFQRNKNMAQYKEMRKRSAAKTKLENPVKRAANIQWGNFIRNNKWMKSETCSKCDSKYKIEAHHEDYKKPLKIVWLCKNCHGARHREINDEIRNGVDWTSKGF